MFHGCRVSSAKAARLDRARLNTEIVPESNTERKSTNSEQVTQKNIVLRTYELFDAKAALRHRHDPESTPLSCPIPVNKPRCSSCRSSPFGGGPNTDDFSTSWDAKVLKFYHEGGGGKAPQVWRFPKHGQGENAKAVIWTPKERRKERKIERKKERKKQTNKQTKKREEKRREEKRREEKKRKEKKRKEKKRKEKAKYHTVSQCGTQSCFQPSHVLRPPVPSRGSPMGGGQPQGGTVGHTCLPSHVAQPAGVLSKRDIAQNNCLLNITAVSRFVRAVSPKHHLLNETW